MAGVNTENWRNGIIIDDEHNVDEEISKEALEEIAADELTAETSTSMRVTSLQQHPPVSKEKPFVPVRTSSRYTTVEGSEELNDEESSNPSHLDTPMTMEQIEVMYADIVKYKIFQLAGDDLAGRPVIAFSMSRLPPRTDIDHHKLFAFMKTLLDQYVESDYTIVYFHYGLSSKNKPSLRWLLHVYNDLGRKYKKNLKALYLVHSTNFIKIVMKVFYPLISTKFGRKINQINHLCELAEHVRLDQLDIPPEVWKHDKEVAFKALSTPGSIFHTKLEDSKTKHFGVPIKYLRERSGLPIPDAVRSTVDFITNNALDVEGIFRRSVQAHVLNGAVDTFNHGVTVQFSMEQVHLAPCLLKKFLRDLPEPLLTFKLYDKVMESCALAEEERLSFTDKMLNEDLPEDNRIMLMFLLQFLQLVIDHSSNNRMNSGSLAIVLGPNLLWSKDEASTLTSMSKINSFTKYLIDNSDMIFNESAA